MMAVSVTFMGDVRATPYTKQPAPREIMQRIWHNECSKDE